MRYKSRVNALIRQIIYYRQAYLLMLPFLVLFSVFIIWPVILSLVMSFTNYNLFQKPEFVGFYNYFKLFFKDDIFLLAFQNTLKFALITGPIGYLMCFFFAWVINELHPKVRSVMTLIFYAPSIAGNVFVIWLVIFDGDMYGYLNSLLTSFGIIDGPIQWLSDPKYMMSTVIIVQLWISLGTSFLTLRAGFNTVDTQYYEAAAIDGIRNRWQELWYVTLPMMQPHLALSAVLSVTAAFASDRVATVMTGFPSTNYATHMLIHHLQDYGLIRHERGYAAAIATVIFLLTVFFNYLFQRFLRRTGR
ncbi:MAG TPA: sugar ABC transporter permease [Clostridiales bacterium]|nr:sugar ABC transporter permease [Clostridiales bacterium]